MSSAKPDESAAAEAGVSAAGHDGVLGITKVDINEHCTGSRWTAADLDLLARIIAIIAMGQATHAAQIINELLPAEPAINDEALSADAKQVLSISGKTDKERDVSRYHRDGLIFEAISWASAQQATNGKALLRDPHIKSTTQGLDGLMIELEDEHSEIRRVTIFEDKCSDNPRRMFRDEIMPAFLTYHEQSRANELVAATAALLGKAGVKGTKATKAAARVLDKEYRAYRGCLAITPKDDSQERRDHLFKGYERLGGIAANQRVGGVLITANDLRAWFDALANLAIANIDNLGTENV